MLRKLLKWPLRAALRNRKLREKLVHELRQDYFADFALSVPLEAGLSCPIRRPDNLHSFAEIFVEREYAALLEAIDLPRRWIDLGCHAGYFSAFLAWQWRQRGSGEFTALLADADPRVAADVAALIASNRLEGRFTFQAGLIGAGAGERKFGLRESMASSASLDGPTDAIRQVKVLTAAEIVALFPPPYDLVKVDIEGAELEFLENYAVVIERAAHLLVEWHSPGAAEALHDAAARRGFERQAVLQPAREHRVGGRIVVTGCDLYRRIE